MNNFISLKGLLGQEPKTLNGENGEFTIISIAQNYQSRAGEKKTSWFEAISFGETGKSLLNLKTGDLVHLIGNLKPQKSTIDGREYVFNRIVIQSATKIAKKKTDDHADIPQFQESEEVPF